MLSGHCILHQPLYLRLSELLTSQVTIVLYVGSVIMIVMIDGRTTASPTHVSCCHPKSLIHTLS